MSTLIVVRDWNRLYENSRSRQIEKLGWVMIPNRHDGEGYATIITHERGPEIFTAWILILQVASRCHPRGSLMKDNGQPHDSTSLALKTRGLKEWFDLAIPLLKETGWLALEEVTTERLLEIRHVADTRLTGGRRVDDIEGKGMEGNGREGNGSDGDSVVPTLEEVRIYALSVHCGFRPDRVDEWFHDQEADEWKRSSGGRQWKKRLQADRLREYWMKPSKRQSTAEADPETARKRATMMRLYANEPNAPTTLNS